MTQNKKVVAYTFSIFAISSAVISFYLNINLSVIASYTGINEYLSEFNIFTKNGGAASDLETHWKYIQILKDDINNLFIYELGVDFKLLNYPLHHLIIAQVPIINSNLKFYLSIFFIISLFLPMLFYKCLVIRYENISKEKLLALASVIYILPGFQYSAIWGNPHITALFFLLFSIYLILKLEKSNFERSKYIYYSIFFLALAAYVKQFYVFLFPFFLLIIFKKKTLPAAISIMVFLILLGLPGLVFLIKNPILLFGLNTLNITNFPSALLISSTIIFFFLIPFIFQYFYNNPTICRALFVEILKEKNTILIITLIFFILNNYFYYEGNIGGGIIYKLSNLVLNNNYIFLMSAYFGIYSIIYYSGNNINNYVLSFLLLITFSTGFFIFQKYFEPMFFILLLTFYDKKRIEKSTVLGINWIILYFTTYYLSLNIIY